jgi:hypothetical protein
MSEYTQVQFALPKNHKIEHVKRKANDLFDAIGIEPIHHERMDNLYRMTISELNFHESLFILDSLKSKYSLQFVIEYGVY